MPAHWCTSSLEQTLVVAPFGTMEGQRENDINYTYFSIVRYPLLVIKKADEMDGIS